MHVYCRLGTCLACTVDVVYMLHACTVMGMLYAQICVLDNMYFTCMQNGPNTCMHVTCILHAC